MPNSLAEPLGPAGGPALRLQVPNEMAALEPARRAVLDFLAGQALSERLVYRLELVLEEALMNRLWHAFPDGGHHVTELKLRLWPDALELQFDDDGVPFDPLQAAPSTAAASLLEREPGGLGLILTRKSASECRYERIDGRNRFTVRMARD